eukprot:TRINITY_DN1713_c0_g1_i1.p1 TRINITY_DN1713_c0_g1~~TRINITY_DN1713_c0_g1_i1.p1  ORF type:complete len:264 (-),score=51.08 TRINITY_DN1713_c0_g1_i1:432-1223(-)
MKIVTYNIHYWVDAEENNNIDRVIQHMKDLEVDIICLQEVYHYPLEPHKHSFLLDLAKALNMEFVFGGSFKHDFGNAVLARLPIVESNTYILLGLDDDYYGNRGMVHTKVLVEKDVYLDVYCTHLDHVSEPTRLNQMRSLLKSVDPEKPHVIIGDFNALKKGDYNEFQLNQITQQRAKGSWELPKFGLTEELQNLGYVDLGDNERYKDGEGSDLVVPTCRFGTRIDYCWGKLFGRFVLTSHKTIISTHSDHNCVEFVFEVNKI